MWTSGIGPRQLPDFFLYIKEKSFVGRKLGNKCFMVENVETS